MRPGAENSAAVNEEAEGGGSPSSPTGDYRTETPPTPPTGVAWWWRHRYWLVLIALLGTYVALWSYISNARMFAFQTQVYDLGIRMAYIWGPYHSVGTWSGLQYFGFSLEYGLPYLLWPFAVSPDYTTLLIVQSFVIGAPALVLFGIGRERSLSPIVGFLVAASYLMNFEIGGMNWYDFHFEAFFPLLFLMGYYLLLRRQLVLSGVLFFLSGWVRVPFMIFPLMFCGVLLLQRYLRKEDWFPLDTRTRIRFVWVLLAACLLYFALIGIFGLFWTGGAAKTTTLVYQGTPWNDLALKLATFGLLALPFLAVLPLARWWVLFLAPYGYLVFFVGWFHYYFPVVFTDQYLAIVVPFVYLAAIDGLKVLEEIAKHPRNSPRTQTERRRTLGIPYHRLGTRGPLFAALSIVAILAVLGPFLLPYGPWNSSSPIDFSFQASTSYNATKYGEYEQVLSYLPPSDGYVVFQQNLPQVLPRPLPYGLPMSPPVDSFGTNYSPDHYPIENVVTRSWVNATIHYVVGEPQATQYYYWGEPSVQTISQQLYTSGFVGVVAEAAGMYLLEAGYHGSPRYYVPWDQSVATSSGEFAVLSDGSRSPDGSIAGPTSNTASNQIWALYYPFFVPGTYQLTFGLRTSTLDPRNNLLIGNPFGERWTVTSSQFAEIDHWTNYSEVVNVTSFYGPVTFEGYCNHWAGQVSIGWIAIHELSPPTS